MPSSKKSPKNKSKSVSLFFAISRWCLRATVILVPLLFTTLTNDSLELTKYVAFSWLVIGGVITGLIAIMLDRGWSWRPVPFGWPLLTWNLAVSLATLFSVNRTVSLWGETGYWHHGLVATILFSVLYVWVNQLADRRFAKELLWWIVGAISAVGIFILLQLRGLYLFPSSLLHSTSFQPLSVSLSLAAVVFAVITIIAVSALRDASNRFGRIMAAAGCVIGLTVLIMLDRSLAWYSLIAGLLALLIINARSRDNIRWGFWINGLLLVAVAGLLIPIPNTLVSDISLATSTSQQVTLGALRADPITGSGPGTFLYDFSHYRPASFNQSLLWDNRFIKAGNDWWQLGATTGIVGLLAWAVLQFVVLRFFWQRLQDEGRSPIAMGLVAVWVLLVVITFLFPSSFTTWFMYWLLLGLAVVVLREEKNTRTAQPRLRTVASFSLAVVLIGGTLVAVTTARLWLGDRSMTQAQAAIDAVKDLSIVEGHLNDAVRYLPHDPTARFAVAQNKIIRVQVGLTDKSMTEQDATDLLQEAIQDGETALALAPQRAESYETLIALYGQVNSITGQATGPAILDLQKKLLDLEPNHPRHYTDLGLSYVARSEALRAQENLDEAGKAQMAKDLTDAQAAFEKAIELKPDFPTGTLGLIRVKQILGATDEALALADQASIDFAKDPSSLYTLGTLYSALESLDKAAQAYTAALALAPDNTTILLSLGQLEERRNNIDQAKSYYQKVLALDAENETARTRLDALSQ